MTSTHADPMQEIQRGQRELAALLRQQIALARLATRATWGWVELQARYAGLSQSQVRAMAERHAGYRGHRGRHFVLTTDQVLAIDEALARLGRNPQPNPQEDDA